MPTLAQLDITLQPQVFNMLVICQIFESLFNRNLSRSLLLRVRPLIRYPAPISVKQKSRCYNPLPNTQPRLKITTMVLWVTL